MPIMPFAKTIFKNLVSKPSTRLYPMTRRLPFERTRGHITIEIEQCIFCGICVRKCPPHAIEIAKAEKMWAIDRLRCIQCNACVEVCPKKCLHMGQSCSSPTSGPSRDQFNA